MNTDITNEIDNIIRFRNFVDKLISELNDSRVDYNIIKFISNSVTEIFHKINNQISDITESDDDDESDNDIEIKRDIITDFLNNNMDFNYHYLKNINEESINNFIDNNYY